MKTPAKNAANRHSIFVSAENAHRSYHQPDFSGGWERIDACRKEMAHEVMALVHPIVMRGSDFSTPVPVLELALRKAWYYAWNQLTEHPEDTAPRAEPILRCVYPLLEPYIQTADE